MPLGLGARLGPYEILSAIGAGGMGEVYRARDTRLDRVVAIKVLPSHVSTDPALRERFEREARAVAALNHPNICTLHDIGRETGVDFLVMEFLEGETLEQRLKKGALPIDQALKYAIQIAAALDKAHRAGIVHRDLKPANIMLTKSGAKVLDFGLAKVTPAVVAASGLSMAPTGVTPVTMQGTLLGTLQYMSPEQIEGQEADSRADIFAFGCVIYETVTGRRAFEAKTQASLIAAILEREPERIAAVQPASPRALDLIVQRCLAKNRDDRWQSAADLASALTWIDEVAPVTQPKPRTSRRSLLLPAAAIGLAMIAAAAVGALAMRSRTVVQPASIAQFQFPLPEGQVLTRAGRPDIAVAPDGQAFAYVANNQIYLRAIGDVAARPITGTAEDVNTPVFSPDGRWIAFYDAPDGILKKVPVGGGVPVAIAKIDNPFGASWIGDDQIVLGQGSKGIATVSANGGPLKTIVGAKAGEVLHNPQILPDGDHVLFTVATSSGADRWDRADIVVQALSSGTRKTVITGGADARYIPAGHLVYAVGSKLLAVRFDLNTLSTAGGAVALTDGVLRGTSPSLNTGAADFAFARNGTMVSVMAQLPEEFRVVVADRDSKDAKTLLPAGDLDKGLLQPRVSPDGKHVALYGGDDSVWLYELSGTNSVRRLTFEGGNENPLWTRDSRKVVFSSNRGGDQALYWQPWDGSAPAELLARPAKGNAYEPLAVTPDGKILAFEVYQPDAGDIWVMSLEADRTPRPLVAIPGSMQAAVSFSPDGHWFAYRSDETGRSEIFVQSFPTTGAKYQITSDGGDYPVWSPDGRNVFCLKKDNFNQVMSVGVTTASTFAFTSATALGIEKLVAYSPATPYDVTPDGRRFLFAQASSQLTSDAQAPQFLVTLNWFEEVKAKVPVN